MNKILTVAGSLVVAVGLSGCGVTTLSAVAAPLDVAKSTVQLDKPKYFYTDEVNKVCKVKKDTGFYSSSLNNDFDLTENEFLFDYLKLMETMSWTKHHDKTSDSLTVDHGMITSRMSKMQIIATEAIINDTLDLQAPKLIELMVGYAENEFIMDSTTEMEIKAMQKAGTYSRCYAGGKNDEKAVCHAHTAQEAARYAGQFIILAIQVQDYMNYKELTIVSDYIENMYNDYIEPWYVNSGAGNDEIYDGFYHMGHGAISKLAYAHWKNNPVMAENVFEDSFKFIDGLVFDDGYIANNSFRGTRGYWYHSLGLNNMLGMVALADQWNYPVSQEITDKLTKASDFLVNKDPEQWEDYLIESYKDKGKYVTVKENNRKIYFGNVTWKKKNTRPYMHQNSYGLEVLINNYTNSTLESIKDTPKYKIWNYKKDKKNTDITLGFNPLCMTQ